MEVASIPHVKFSYHSQRSAAADCASSVSSGTNLQDHDITTAGLVDQGALLFTWDLSKKSRQASANSFLTFLVRSCGRTTRTVLSQSILASSNLDSGLVYNSGVIFIDPSPNTRVLPSEIRSFVLCLCAQTSSPYGPATRLGPTYLSRPSCAAWS